MTRIKALIPGRTEAQVLAQVLEAAAMLGLDLDRNNTGAGLNPKGQMVRFGRPGDADLSGTLPDGRTIQVEIKREGFDPNRLRGAKRAHFERQLERLRKTNALGGVGFWCDDSEFFLMVVRVVLDGGSVEEPGYDKLAIRMGEYPR